jgi:hypothetical protein
MPQPPQPRPMPPPPMQQRPMPPQPAITLPPRDERPQGAVAQPPSWQPRAPQGAAPLPPRTVLPGANAPRFIKPMPGPAWMPPPQASQGAPMAPEVGRGAPPPNLPTATQPAPSAAQPEEGAFNTLPPLAKPKPTRDPQAPHTDYPSDPYREPLG